MFKVRVFIPVIAVICLLTTVVGLAIGYDSARQKKQKENQELFMKESHELRLQRQELMVEYENCEKYTLNRLADGNFVGIVFTGIDKQLYTSAFAAMQQRANPIVGTMCLSRTNLPGGEGLISAEEYSEMLSAGWDVALYYDGTEELEAYLRDMGAVLSEKGIDMPKTVLFKKNTYFSIYDQTLDTYGIKNALHHGESGMPIIEQSVVGNIWHPGVVYWNVKGLSSATLTEAVTVGGIFFFELSFEGNGQVLYNGDDEERTYYFGRMLNTIDGFIAKEKIRSINLEEAKKLRIDYLTLREGLLEEVSIRRAEIQVELREINAKISEIYKKYNG